MSRPWIVLLRMSIPRTSLLRRSRVRIWLFRMSRLRTSLFLISRLSISPVAKPYETPPKATNRAIRATIIAGDGRRASNDFTELLLGGLGGEVSLDQHASGVIGAGRGPYRKGDNEAGPAALRVPDLHLAPVGGRHGADDRQAEAAAPAGSRVAGASGESLEDALAHVDRHAGAAVRDLEHGPVALLPHRHRHRRPGG